MGFEATDSQQQQTPAPESLNFLSIRTPHHDSTTAERNEIFPDLPALPGRSRSSAFSGTRTESGAHNAKAHSNLAGLPEVKSESRTLDLSAPIYPADKRTPDLRIQSDSRPTPSDTRPALKTPANKYEIAVKEQVSQLASEANFTRFTDGALNRDADRFPPVRNEQDGTTTYTIEQIGITDRDLNPEQTTANRYKRLVNITVPDIASSLQECKFVYGDRQTIDTNEFDALVDHSQKRQAELSAISSDYSKLTGDKDMSFYTHGIRTGAEDADFMALALQLTNGHSVINVDWKSTAVRDETYGMQTAYEINRRGAAESYPKFEAALDHAVSHIGAAHTDMIAFSHGAMFDTRYLQHRKETFAPKLDEVVFAHPDVKCTAMKAADGKGNVPSAEQLYSSVARRSFVIGTTGDLAMTGAAWNDCESAPKGSSFTEKMSYHDKQMQIHARLGNGGQMSRTLVTGHGGTYVTETMPTDKKDAYNHFVNMGKINGLINDPDAAMKLATLEK